MATGVRNTITLACNDCKRRSYQTSKSKRNTPDRIEMQKYCRWCGGTRAIRKRANGSEHPAEARPEAPRTVEGRRRAAEGRLARARIKQQTARGAGRQAADRLTPCPGGGTRRFIGESTAELKKVEWPNRAQVMQGTIVVIIACAIVGAYLWLADFAFEPLVKNILLGMAMFQWYVINTYSGHENKVKANLEHRIISMNQGPRFRRVVVPTEQVIETKDGQKVQSEKRVLPGYVLVNMDLDDDAWTVVKNTPGVTGFVGAGNNPGASVAARGRPHPQDRRGVGRPAAAPGRVFARRVGEGNLRPAVRLRRRDRRRQRRRAEAEGAR